MKITVLFMLRKESYHGEFGPEVLGAIDEFVRDENPDAWPEEVEGLKRRYKDEAAGFAEVNIEVNQDQVRKLILGQAPVLKGEIV